MVKRILREQHPAPRRPARRSRSGVSARTKRIVFSVAVISISVSVLLFTVVRLLRSNSALGESDIQGAERILVTVDGRSYRAEADGAGFTLRETSPAPTDEVRLFLTADECIRLVDALGGITVTVERLVQYVNPKDGLTYRIEPGQRLLDGARSRVLLENPRTARAVSLRLLLLGLGRRMKETAADSAVREELINAALPRRIRKDRALVVKTLSRLLEVLAATGPADVIVKVSEPTAEETSREMPKKRKEEAGVRRRTVRVLILNGDGTPGLAKRAAAQLLPPRFRITDTTNADNFRYERTVIRSRDERAAREIRALLGVGLLQNVASPPGSDATVILGHDARGRWR